jgi:hypothetical protein
LAKGQHADRGARKADTNIDTLNNDAEQAKERRYRRVAGRLDTVAARGVASVALANSTMAYNFRERYRVEIR